MSDKLPACRTIRGAACGTAKLAARRTTSLALPVPAPLLPVLDQASLDRIVQNILYNAVKLSIITHHVIITFVMPELAAAFEQGISLIRRPAFERMHNHIQRRVHTLIQQTIFSLLGLQTFFR